MNDDVLAVGWRTTLDCKEFVLGSEDSEDEDEDVYDIILLLLLFVFEVLYWRLGSKPLLARSFLSSYKKMYSLNWISTG